MADRDSAMMLRPLDPIAAGAQRLEIKADRLDTNFDRLETRVKAVEERLVALEAGR